MTGPFPDPAATRPFDRLVRDPALRGAIAHWDGLRGGRRMPARMDLDPAVLRPHLQDCAILEVPRPGSVRIRLGGARISALIGLDVRGMPLRSLFDLADRARVADAVERALAAPKALLLDVVSPAPRFGRAGETVLHAQIAILPMTDADLAPTRALYVMSLADSAAEMTGAPHRWHAARIQAVELFPGQPVLSADRLGAPAPLARPATPRLEGAPADEPASERRGPLARARFRVIQGGLA